MADHGATSSSSKSSFIYDVFLSFRGDTRHSFTDHLYRALTSKGINTFRDDPKLRLGDEIRSTLVEAIERSRMSIVVLCQNCASSTWCLDELVKIMECKEKGRSIFPIFYHVEPSGVGHQKNKYEVAMIKHENRYGRDSPKVAAWRSALAAVSKISGKPCMQNTSEVELIDKIVEEVLNKLSLKTLYIKHSIGFDSQLEEVKLRLDIESHDTICMLRIYGDDEICKTTFAVELYNKIKPQFEAASFLANVSEKSKADINGIENLQKTLLSEMGDEIKTKIGSTFRGSFEIKRRLGHKRILLVLDDVDSIQQLASLVGGSDWFGPGSRIIVTTKDIDVLNKHVLENVKIETYCLGEGEVEGNKRRKDIGEEHVVGLMNSFNIILDQLKEKDSCRNIVSIIGMGGLGKTTLAKRIYYNNETKRLFPCRAWVCFSHDYRIREVLSSLLHDLMPSALEYKTLSEEEEKDELRKYLRKNKYLIVLDDIWEPEVWNDMRYVFPDNNNGSRILITSRNKEVANYPNSSHIHHLPLLDENESWELFCKEVFWGKKCPNDLEDIGRSIFERCEGLPIAIITLGGLLARKSRSRREWSLIKDLVPWHIAQDKENVMNVLELSYKNLPQRLKHCFLYFGMFPEDCEISARQLIQLWIVEGFIQLVETGASNAPEPEDVADIYLDELVNRSLVQVTRRRSDGGVKQCRIHDLLRQLCISVSKAENIFEIWTKPNNHRIISNPHRLSLLSNTESYLSAVKSNESCTRSLFIFDGNEHSNDTLENFPSVRVLHFGNLACLKSTASCSETMTSLRYLRIDKTNRFYDVSNCIWSLLNLETLCLKGRVRNSRMNMKPSGIWKLEKLRHAHLSWCVRLPLEQREAASSKPMWNLQTISVVAFDQQLSILINSGIFSNLKKLGLRYDAEQENCNSLHEQLQSLHHLTKLRTLKIYFLRSHVSLDAIVFPSSLNKISFLGFGDLTFGSINTVGQLPNLQCLKLIVGRIPQALICSAGEFPQLQVLRMEGVEVQSWILEKGAMPRLQSLVVKKCSELNELPEQLWSLTTLRQVHLTDPSDALRKSILPFLEFNNDCNITIDNS